MAPGRTEAREEQLLPLRVSKLSSSGRTHPDPDVSRVRQEMSKAVGAVEEQIKLLVHRLLRSRLRLKHFRSRQAGAYKNYLGREMRAAVNQKAPDPSSSRAAECNVEVAGGYEMASYLIKFPIKHNGSDLAGPSFINVSETLAEADSKGRLMIWYSDLTVAFYHTIIETFNDEDTLDDLRKLAGPSSPRLPACISNRWMMNLTYE
jgi:hypothetical protein